MKSKTAHELISCAVLFEQSKSKTGRKGMGRKLLVAFVSLWAVIFLGISVPSFAKSIANDTALYSSLPGAGLASHPSTIKSALDTVKKMQKRKFQRVVKFSGPRELIILNERYLTITYNATAKRLGSGQNKTHKVVYALLFERSSSNELTFYDNIFLTWIGEKDLESYKTIKRTKIAEYFRKKGAEYVFFNAANVKKAKPQSFDASLIKSGIVKEKFIDGAITRDGELKGILESYVQKGSMPAPVQAPSSDKRINALEARIKKLEALLSNVKRNGKDIVFNNMNVHIQNGTGSTEKVNGKGNLIVGYGSTGRGSHNVSVGNSNKYSSFGSIVSGANNVVSRKYSVAAGGKLNKSSGDYSVILGGRDNRAEGAYSSVLGGSGNKAKGEYSSINGQRDRTKVDAGKNKHFKNN